MPPDAANPLVSIVMPTFNRATHIGAALRSLLDGDCRDIEILVCDDGTGADGTAEAVARGADGDARVVYHRNPMRLGMPRNLNEGIRAARGRYIAVAHDHDLYEPSFVASMLGLLERHPTALYAHCAITVIDEEGRVVRTSNGGWPELTSGGRWLQRMLSSLHSPVCALTVVRASAHERFGLYDQRYGFVADVEMWMRLATHGDVAYVARPQVAVRERESDHVASADRRFAATMLRSIVVMQRAYGRRAFTARHAVGHRIKLERAYLVAAASLATRSLRRHLVRLLTRVGGPEGRVA